MSDGYNWDRFIRNAKARFEEGVETLRETMDDNLAVQEAVSTDYDPEQLDERPMPEVGQRVCLLNRMHLGRHSFGVVDRVKPRECKIRVKIGSLGISTWIPWDARVAFTSRGGLPNEWMYETE